MNPWWPVDRLADWLRHSFGVQAQLRMGVVMFLIGLGYLLYWPWAAEPPAIFTMSALALLFAGIGVVVSAETLAEVATDVGEVAEDVERCPTCGAPRSSD